LNWNSIKADLRSLFVPANDSRYAYTLLGLITLVAFILRALLLNQPILYDEAYTFVFYASKSFATIVANYSAPNNHIFHTLLVALVYKLFGASPLLLRVPAFVAGVLCVPAAYIAARRFFSENQSLAAAALIALTPGLIEYSANGRGYTLIALFSLLLANFAGILVREQKRPALIAYGLTAAFGFFTIPIFLYPMAGLSLWLAASYLTESGARQSAFRSLKVFLFTCALAGVLTVLLYSPVIFFGTGLGSLVGNEIVEAQNWPTFFGNLPSRMINTGMLWVRGIPPIFSVLILVGFLLSLFFYKKVSNQRLPLQIYLIVAAAVCMALQRVVPLPRVWLFLEAFYMLFVAAGMVWVLEWLLGFLSTFRFKSALIPTLTILLPLGALLSTLSGWRTAIVQENDSPEEFAAAYILENIQPDDTIIALPPVDIQTAYYLLVQGIPFDRFFQRDHPSEIKKALVLVRTNAKDDTLKSVLNYYELAPNFLLGRATLVYEYGPLQIYSVPARRK
jgi:hypothetical protein